MILSDDEIMVINQTAEFDSAIGYARAIEAKVLEKLSDRLRDAERMDFIESVDVSKYILSCGKRWYWRSGYGKSHRRANSFREAIDVAIKESR